MSRPTIRCAIYTRKSSDEGLDQEFNSLDAQHEGGVRPIRTRLYMGRMAVPYSAQRPRHSARAAARFSLKFGLV
jgi:hypothetical protein